MIEVRHTGESGPLEFEVAVRQGHSSPRHHGPGELRPADGGQAHAGAVRAVGGVTGHSDHPCWGCRHFVPAEGGRASSNKTLPARSRPTMHKVRLSRVTACAIAS